MSSASTLRHGGASQSALGIVLDMGEQVFLFLAGPREEQSQLCCKAISSTAVTGSGYQRACGFEHIQQAQRVCSSMRSDEDVQDDLGIFALTSVRILDYVVAPTCSGDRQNSPNTARSRNNRTSMLLNAGIGNARGRVGKRWSKERTASGRLRWRSCSHARRLAFHAVVGGSHGTRCRVSRSEVAPAAIKRSLPQPFERKEHHGSACGIIC